MFHSCLERDHFSTSVIYYYTFHYRKYIICLIDHLGLMIFTNCKFFWGLTHCIVIIYSSKSPSTDVRNLYIFLLNSKPIFLDVVAYPAARRMGISCNNVSPCSCVQMSYFLKRAIKTIQNDTLLFKIPPADLVKWDI